MHSAQVGRLDRKRVDWVGLAVLAGIVGILLWRTVASVQQSARYKTLARAAQRGDVEAVRSLVASGHYDTAALTDALNDGLNTPPSAKKQAVVRFLLDHGASPNGRSNGWTPLGWAIQQDDVASIRLLTDRGIDPNGSSPWYGTMLDLAVQTGHPKAALALLDAGADPKRNANVGNNSLLAQAMQQGGSDTLVRKLLEKGVSISDFSAGTGQTPLITAATMNRADWVKLLLKKGAKVDARDGTGLTALMNAAQQGHTKTAKLLLDAGANVNAVNGKTSVLAYAALKGAPQMVRLLLQHGADPSGKGTPLQYARQGGNPQIARMLEQAGATK